jgi:hypothetical protein
LVTRLSQLAWFVEQFEVKGEAQATKDAYSNTKAGLGFCAEDVPVHILYGSLQVEI